LTIQVLTGLLLVLPVAYDLLFALLARTFDYPDILRQPTSQILARFAAGGSRLVLTWWGFAMSAVLFAPTVVLLSATLADANPAVLALATALGLLAALVQFLGPIRWPFAVPHLARLAAGPATTPATSDAVEVTFQTLNRYLGVAVGEHLGYLFTGLWSALAGIALIQSDLLHPLFGIVGLILAPLFLLGSLEFVGGFEARGWKLAGSLVPLAYTGWSIWLLALGIGFLQTIWATNSSKRELAPARRRATSGSGDRARRGNIFPAASAATGCVVWLTRPAEPVGWSLACRSAVGGVDGVAARRACSRRSLIAR
jgi:hypothetical protein